MCFTLSVIETLLWEVRRMDGRGQSGSPESIWKVAE